MSGNHQPVTETGGTYCALPMASGETACQCESCREDAQAATEVRQSLSSLKPNSRWANARSAIAFGIACLTSPCCTPLIVPLGLALLAGTPVAGWLAYNLGWVYGAFTLISILSFVLAFRWWTQQSGNNKPITQLRRPVSNTADKSPLGDITQ